MKIVVALFMGLCSGVMIYFMAAMTFMDMSAGSGPLGAFVAVSFLGGWALSTWLLLRGAISLSKVFSRGLSTRRSRVAADGSSWFHFRR